MFRIFNVAMVMLMLLVLSFLGYNDVQAQVDSTTLNNTNITSIVTLNAATRYIMKQFVYVKNGGQLVIPPGTIIQGDKGNGTTILPGCLIVERGGKLMANGTPAQPIVFTSRFAPGLRGPGDWAGIILLGKATINTVSGADTNAIEGMPTGITLYYGGHDDADNSGILRYIRIEFPGINLTGSSGNEINGLTMGGVGSGTQIEYVQVSYSGDDSFEWFGGTVNCKYLISYKEVDDIFDSDNGYRGKCQFLLGVVDSNIADGSGTNGFESDNNANSPNNYNAPRTKPIFSNVTLQGPYHFLTSTVNPNHQRGGHIRRNTLLNCFNTIISSFRVGTRLDGQGVANACNGDTIRFRNNIYAGNLTLADTANMGGNGFNAINWLTTPSFSNRVYNVNDSLRLTNPWGFENGGNWVPQANSPALTGASFTDPNLLDPFFTPVTYVGAFGLVNWTIGWAEFNPLNYVIGIQQISSEVPASFSLSQNYPNPFNPNTNIKFSIPRAGFVTLKIYNSLGEEVKTLVSQDLNIGTYKVDFNALNLSSGIYFYRIRVKAEHNFEWAESRKMMLVK